MDIGRAKTAILDNNTVLANEVLDEFCPLCEDAPLYLTRTGANIASIMLKTAATLSYYDALDDNLTYTLIERLGTKVDLFSFLRGIVVVEDIDDYLTRIPVKVITALRQNEYSDEVISEIHDLRDNTTFKVILACIAGKDEIDRLSYKFSVPLIKEVYVRKIVPAHIIFCEMNKNLYNPNTYDATIDFIAELLVPEVIYSILFGPSRDDGSDE